MHSCAVVSKVEYSNDGIYQEVGSVVQAMTSCDTQCCTSNTTANYTAQQAQQQAEDKYISEQQATAEA